MLKKSSGFSRRIGNGNRASYRGGDDASAVNSRIGGMLKDYYQDLVSHDIPERFVDLLKRLEENDWSQQESAGKERIEGVQGWAARFDS